MLKLLLFPALLGQPKLFPAQPRLPLQRFVGRLALRLRERAHLLDPRDLLLARQVRIWWQLKRVRRVIPREEEQLLRARPPVVQAAARAAAHGSAAWRGRHRARGHRVRARACATPPGSRQGAAHLKGGSLCRAGSISTIGSEWSCTLLSSAGSWWRNTSRRATVRVVRSSSERQSVRQACAAAGHVCVHLGLGFGATVHSAGEAVVVHHHRDARLAPLAGVQLQHHVLCRVQRHLRAAQEGTAGTHAFRGAGTNSCRGGRSCGLLRNRRGNCDFSDEVQTLGRGIKQVARMLPARLPPDYQQMFNERFTGLCEQKVPEDIANRICQCDFIFSASSFVEIQQSTGESLAKVVDIYYTVGEELQLNWLGQIINQLPVNNYWQALARETYLDDLAWQQRALSSNVITDTGCSGTAHQQVEQWIALNEQALSRTGQILGQLQSEAQPDYAMFSVALRELLTLAQITASLTR